MTAASDSMAHPYPDLPDAVQRMTPITTYAGIHEILSSRDFKQGGTNLSAPSYLGIVSSLNGPEHLKRRRLESALFKPSVLAERHAQGINDVLDAVMKHTFANDESVQVDLTALVSRIENLLMAKFVGIPVEADDDALIAQIDTAVRAAGESVVVVWSKSQEPIADAARIRRIQVDFTEQVLLPVVTAAASRDRSASAETLIDLLMDNYDPLEWDGELVIREINAFLAGGVQTSVVGILQTLRHLLPWLREHPEDLANALDESHEFLARAVAEGLRLHVPSQALFRIARNDGETRGGTPYAKDQEFALWTAIANVDEDTFGSDADQYRPHREVPHGIPRWGLAFGQGPHVCSGRSLALGNTRGDEGALFAGSTVAVIRRLLEHGVRFVENRPPTFRQDTFKPVFEAFPAELDRVRNDASESVSSR